MRYDEIERSLGVGSEDSDRVIDAELVSPGRLRLITIASLVISMGAVATAAWFAAVATTRPAEQSAVHQSSQPLVDVVRQDAFDALHASIDDREETYKALFEANQDRVSSLEARTKQLETARAALLPLIGNAMSAIEESPRSEAATKTTPQKPVEKKPQVAMPARQAAPQPSVATIAPPPPRPAQMVVPPIAPTPTQTSTIDETSLPMRVISKQTAGIQFKGESEIMDSSGKSVRAGQTAAGLDGKVLRISPEEGLVITDQRIYVLE